MKYFYTRVSTREQNLSRQIHFAKEKVPDVTEIFSDRQSGKNFDRTEYQKLKAIIQPGDELYVKELDRLGRNKDEIKSELNYFRKEGVIIRIFDIPTTLIDYQGQEWVMDMITNILVEVLGAMAEQERVHIRQRQKEGIEAMKKDGNWDKYGRPAYNGKIDRKPNETVLQCCQRLKISKTTYYKYAGGVAHE